MSKVGVHREGGTKGSVNWVQVVGVGVGGGECLPGEEASWIQAVSHFGE